MNTPAKPKPCQELVPDGHRMRTCKRPAVDGKYCKPHADRRRLWALKTKRAGAC
jgi:hypothetical protein